MTSDDVVIVGAKRTAIGALLGQFSGVPTPALGAAALRAAIAAAGVPPESIDEVVLGCVLQANVGQAPARQAAMGAGLPLGVGATTVNKVCGSGMKAVMLARDLIVAGSANIVAAGGMECMSNAPHLVPVRAGIALGDSTFIDHLLRDGINNADGRSLGLFSEDCAAKYGFTRAQQEAYVIESIRRARRAAEDGTFAREIVPFARAERGAVLAHDEQIARADIERLRQLPPAFKPDGTITAATASGFCDGAAAVLLMRAGEATARGIAPLARIVAHATHSQAPEWFTTAPVDAIRKLAAKAGWSLDEVDLFEVNEALAVVPLAVMQDLGLPHDKLNVNGGACVLGHPIGASGARLVVTLAHTLKARGLKRGIASLCIGGGEAVAIAIEAC
jgi:acetyl-CoA C-acetyltransferase